MTNALRLCWWEVEELVDHLTSRPDLWTQSDDNPMLWVREEPRSTEPIQAFALLIVPPPTASSPFRTYVLQTVSITWDESHIELYMKWILGHWTSFRRRVVVSEFLQSELKVDAETAHLAAIAIEGLSWQENETPKPDLPALQEELWPTENVPPSAADFTADPTLLGTHLLSGGVGWVQLRLIGGMLRTTMSVRGRTTPELVTMQGLLRPTRGSARDAAAVLAGWAAEERQDGVDHLDPSPTQQELH